MNESTTSSQTSSFVDSADTCAMSNISATVGTPPKRSLLQYLQLLLKGLAMGAADVVPGVSGGTIAFISGIYEELLDSLRAMTPHAVGVLWRNGLQAFWQHINGTFLVVLLTGIAISLFSLARLISHSLETYPVLVWAFFFGLVVSSIIYISRQLGGWSWREWVALAVGTAIALGVSIAKPAQLPAEWWMVFLAGSIAICAMILPGISGSFILLLMGMYSVFLNALKSLDLILLGCFFAGCACGLLVFSHLLSWLLRRYHSTTLSLLIGFLLGSLNVIWPWKQTLETMVDRHGKTIPLVQENLMPWSYSAMTGHESFAVLAGLLMLLGMALVLGLEYWSDRKDTANIH